IPGHPMDPRAKGTNSLIRSQALLVETAEEILAALGTRIRTPLSDPTRDLFHAPPEAPLDNARLKEARETVRELLGHAPTPVDELIRLSGAPPAAVLTVLLEMELAGLLQRHPGNRVSLA
ncbi:MAG TPA: DNA-protecting protein DprA, partial [Sphingomonadales bacterium]|nr:DNA-protecting protein DprA [Sphingomonadales bacterium]